MAATTKTVKKLIGRTTNFEGKPLWEIVGNLRNFGVGRYVIRHLTERYPEPSYMRILKVEALPDEEPGQYRDRKCRVYVERVFRGVRHDKPVELESTSYKADYKLMPLNWVPPPLSEVKVREVSATKELPPLMKEYFKRVWKTDEVQRIPAVIRKGVNSRYKLAES